MSKLVRNFTLRKRGETKSKDPVKVTALIYLREALLKEKYEDCAEIIATAKEFGAQDSEIRNLLEEPRRAPG